MKVMTDEMLDAIGKMNKMEHHVAKAIYAAHVHDYIGQARAAIQAMRKPSEDMAAEGADLLIGLTSDGREKFVAEMIWKAMIDAALDEKKETAE